jgi:hypothetical protein
VAVGVALVVAGVVTALVAQQPRVEEAGWFVYAPGADPTRLDTEPSWIVLTGAQAVGCLAGVVGLLVLVGGIGYRVGRRDHAPRQRQSAST